MRKWRRIKRHCLAFVMCLMATLLILSLSVCVTMTQGSFVKNLGSANYYQSAKNAIIEQFNNIAIPSGLPQDFFKDLNLEIDVYEDVNEQVKAAFNGSEIVLNKVEIGEAIDSDIREYVMAQGQQIDFATEIEIKSIVDDCVQEYEKQIIVPHLDQTVGMWKKTATYVNIANIVLVLAILLGCIKIILSKKWKHHKVSYMAYTFLGAGVACGVISLVTQLIGLYEKVNISPVHVKDFVIAIIHDVLTNIASFGTVAFLVGVVLATLSLSFGKKEVRYRRSRK